MNKKEHWSSSLKVMPDGKTLDENDEYTKSWKLALIEASKKAIKEDPLHIVEKKKPIDFIFREKSYSVPIKFLMPDLSEEGECE